MPTTANEKKDRLEVWHDGSATCIIAVSAFGDPLDLSEREVELLIEQLQACLREERGRARKT